MKKHLLIILLFVLFIISVKSQSTAKARLIKTFQPIYYEDISESLDNGMLEVGSQIDLQNDSLAVRVCSNDPLPIAFAFAQGLPLFVKTNLGSYNAGFSYSKTKIYFL